MALTTVPASLSATAITLTTAAQPNITSVGTLTGLTVSGNIAGTLTTAAQTNITSVGTLTGLATSGSVGFRTSADSNYALKLLQSQSLTHGGYFQINGGSATGLEINATSGSYSGTALFVQQSTVATGGFLARFANSSGNKVTIETDGTTNFAGNVKATDIIAAGSSGLSLQTDEGTKRVVINDNGSVVIGPGAATQQGGGLLTLEGPDAVHLVLHRTADTGDQEIVFMDHGDHNATVSGKNGGGLRLLTNGRNTTALDLTSTGVATFGGRINFPEHIIGSMSGGYLQVRGTGSRYWAIGSTGGNAVPTTASATLGFHHYDGSSWTQNKINITASGKLGVGTDNPDVPLQVSGDSTAGGILIKQGAQITYTPSSLANFRQGITFENTGSGHAYSIGYGQGGKIKFSYFDNSSTYSELASIEGSSGDMVLSSGSLILQSGEGISFSATANSSGTMSSELLDDYEEGTWTPLLIAGTTNPTGGGALHPYGSYTKVGNRVTVTYYVGRSYTNTPAGQIYVSGLPFTIKNVVGNVQYHYVATYNINFNGGMTMGVPDRGASTFNLYAVQNSSGWTQIDWTSHTSSPIYVSGSFTYIVD